MTQNRRPILSDFRIFPPNLAVVPLPRITLAAIQHRRPDAVSLAVVVEGMNPAKNTRGSILGSPVVPQTGSQIIYWTVTDADGDTLAYTLSIRPENSETWTDLAVGIPAIPTCSSISARLPRAPISTRLTVQEQAPRPEKQRLTYT